MRRLAAAAGVLLLIAGCDGSSAPFLCYPAGEITAPPADDAALRERLFKLPHEIVAVTRDGKDIRSLSHYRHRHGGGGVIPLNASLAKPLAISDFLIFDGEAPCGIAVRPAPDAEWRVLWLEAEPLSRIAGYSGVIESAWGRIPGKLTPRGDSGR